MSRVTLKPWWALAGFLWIVHWRTSTVCWWYCILQLRHCLRRLFSSCRHAVCVTYRCSWVEEVVVQSQVVPDCRRREFQLSQSAAFRRRTLPSRQVTSAYAFALVLNFGFSYDHRTAPWAGPQQQAAHVMTMKLASVVANVDAVIDDCDAGLIDSRCVSALHEPDCVRIGIRSHRTNDSERASTPRCSSHSPAEVEAVGDELRGCSMVVEVCLGDCSDCSRCSSCSTGGAEASSGLCGGDQGAGVAVPTSGSGCQLLT